MLRQQVAEGRRALRDEYLRHPNPRLLVHRHTQLVDRAVKALWAESSISGTALIATGGYGRQELYPCSDIDLRILLAGELPDAGRERVERLIGMCWDAGLEIAHSVRTVQGCADAAAEDITIQTTLMESRFLTGSRKLFRELVERLHASIDPVAFFKAKKLEQEQRHAKHQDTPYALEPN